MMSEQDRALAVRRAAKAHKLYMKLRESFQKEVRKAAVPEDIKHIVISDAMAFFVTDVFREATPLFCDVLLAMMEFKKSQAADE